MDILWVGAPGEDGPFPLGVHPLLRWHVLPPTPRVLEGSAAVRDSMRVFWWLRSRAEPITCAHFVGRAAALAHYTIVAKRADMHFQGTLLTVDARGSIAPPPEPAEPAPSAGGALLEETEVRCLLSHAVRHADVCVVASQAEQRAVHAAGVCAREPAVLALALSPASRRQAHRPDLAAGGRAEPPAEPLAAHAALWRRAHGPDFVRAQHRAAEAVAGQERAQARATYASHARGSADGPEQVASASASGAADSTGRAGGAAGAAAAPTGSALLSVCIVSHNRGEMLRQAVRSILPQLDAPAVAPLGLTLGGGGGWAGASGAELIVVDDASTDAPTMAVLAALEAELAHAAAGVRGRVVRLGEGRYLGAARNAAVQLARGAWLLFMDDDNVAKAGMVRAFVRAAVHSGADLVTCVNHKWHERAEPPTDAASGGAGWPADERVASEHFLPVGPCAELGAHANCFGDAHMLVRRAAFGALGGYSTDFGLGLEDWELYARAALRAHARAGSGARVGAPRAPLHHLVLPEPLYWYRSVAGGGMLARQHAGAPDAVAQARADRLRALRPYVEDAWLHPSPADGGTPSLEPLLLYSESLRVREGQPACGRASLARVGAGGAAALLALAAAARGWRRRQRGRTSRRAEAARIRPACVLRVVGIGHAIALRVRELAAAGLIPLRLARRQRAE